MSDGYVSADDRCVCGHIRAAHEPTSYGGGNGLDYSCGMCGCGEFAPEPGQQQLSECQRELEEVRDCFKHESAMYYAAQQQLQQMKEALQQFIANRGRHDGEHNADGRHCTKCEEAYVMAESELDAVVGIL